MNGWQPIDTAPKDGSKILVYGWPEDHPGGMVRFHAAGAYTAYWDELDSAFCIAGAPWDGPFIPATHWQPLPKPPEDA